MPPPRVLWRARPRSCLEGFTIGYVKRLIPLPDLLQLDAEVIIHPHAERYMLSDTQFWLAKPKLSLKGITNLESLVKGNFIQVQMTGKGQPQRQFVALTQAPVPIIRAPGLRVTAVTNDIGSIDIGTPVYYKKIAVGQVQSWQLDQKTDTINSSYFHKRRLSTSRQDHLALLECQRYQCQRRAFGH